MSFELSVHGKKPFPSDLKNQWEARLQNLGAMIEIHPSFAPGTWKGGFLPMKVSAMPDVLIGVALRPPALSGFEVSFSGSTSDFRSALGRTSTEFALLCLCAAELAYITEGLLFDGQAGASVGGDKALAYARDEVRKYLGTVGARELRQYPFTAWR